MRSLFLLCFVAGAIVAQAQFTFRYRNCTGCPTTNTSMSGPTSGFNYTYSPTIQHFTSTNIASDYGRRNTNSRWHMGLDLGTESGDDEVGNALFAIETGTVIVVKGTGYKRIVVRGTHRYGFGHIFFDGTPDAGGMRSGNFILKKMDGIWSDYWAIIYFEGATVTALGETVGNALNPATVTHPSLNNGLPITVRRDITNQGTDPNFDRPIAPLGDSGDDNANDATTFAAHVHLYDFQNDPQPNDFASGYPGAYNTTRFRNPKNPLQFLQNAGYRPTYNITFPADTPPAGSPAANQLIYPGNQRSSFLVRAAMAGQVGGGGYTRAMDVDLVELQFKKPLQPESAYRMYQGPVLESKIAYGGRLNTDRYPSFGFPAHNTGTEAIDIAKGSATVNNVGDATRTGVRTHAYSNGGQPYDDFYFSDFFSRIHRNDNYGGASPMIANDPRDARYLDGPYDYRAVVTTAEGQVHTSATQHLVIDNFRPYIKEVIVRRLNEFGPLVYRGFWDWNGSQLTLFKENYTNAGTVENLWIKVIASEPLQSDFTNPVRINIPSRDGSTYRAMNVVAGTNDTEFTFTYGVSLPGGFANGSNMINITGVDFSGHPLERMTTSPTTIATQIAGSAWSGSPNPGTDQNHSFNAGSPSCNTPGGRSKTGECLIVNFYSHVRQVPPGSPVEFTNLSSGEGPLQHIWNFGSGASPATATGFGPHAVVYSSTGEKTVSLYVSDANGSYTETKTNYISVSQTTSNVDFTASAIAGTQPHVTTFTATYSGSATSYAWTFPGGSPSSSTEPNPTVTYSSAGSFDVTLTINGYATVTKAGHVTVNAPPPMSASVSHCSNYYFTGCNSSYLQHDPIYFDAAITGGTPFFTYQWTFGDGGTSTSLAPLYSYSNAGTYSVTLTVTDSRGQSTSASTSVTIGSRTPYVTTDFTINDPSVSTGDAPVLFTDATDTNVGVGDLQYYWDFGSGAYPRYAYSQGPHQVCYSTTGPKTVYLSVEDNYSAAGDFEYDNVYVNSTNLSSCPWLAGGWQTTPGASVVAGQHNGYFPHLVGIPNGNLSTLSCSTSGMWSDLGKCAFSPDGLCLESPFFASHGDPSLYMTDRGPSFRLWTSGRILKTYDGAYYTIISGDGIYYQHPVNFRAGETYRLSFWAKTGNTPGSQTNYYAPSHVKVALTSGLNPFVYCDGNGPSSGNAFPSYSFNMYELGTFYNSTLNGLWNNFTVSFTAPSDDFNQIWIYPKPEESILPIENEGGNANRRNEVVFLDDFSLRSYDNDCPEDIVVNASSSVNTVYKADGLVATSGEYVLNSGQNAEFRSGNSVHLMPGFKALAGSTFMAIIEECDVHLEVRTNGEDPNGDLHTTIFDRVHFPADPKLNGLYGSESATAAPENSFKVVPNPAKDKLRVVASFEKETSATISLLSVMGVELVTVKRENVMQLDEEIRLDGLPRGVYMIRLRTLRGLEVEKVIVE